MNETWKSVCDAENNRNGRESMRGTRPVSRRMRDNTPAVSTETGESGGPAEKLSAQISRTREEEPQCVFTWGVCCSVTDAARCESCGWNPEVSEARLQRGFSEEEIRAMRKIRIKKQEELS